MLQRVTACCSVLQFVAVWYIVLQCGVVFVVVCVAVYDAASILFHCFQQLILIPIEMQCAAVCCSVCCNVCCNVCCSVCCSINRVPLPFSIDFYPYSGAVRGSVLQRVLMCVVMCVAVCCMRVAVSTSLYCLLQLTFISY